MRSAKTPILVSLIVIAGLVAALLWEGHRPPQPAAPQSGNKSATSTTATLASGTPALFVYCAAGLKPPLEAIARDYEREYHTRIELQYGGSGTLLANLRVSGKGDLFVAADASYIDLALAQKLMDETIPLANQRPVLAVAKGNPKHIRGVDDLARSDLKVVLANPGTASVGKAGQTILEKRGLWKTVEAATSARGVFKPTVNDVANDLKLGTADAGIVWDATIAQYPELESLPLAGGEAFNVPITVGVLRSTSAPRAALHFARYLAAPEKGLAVFKKLGYLPVEGDAWADEPQLLYYSGSVNRVAIQETLKAFEAREGVHITTVFNGCGILTGQMKLGERPDVYQTCDAIFMKGVEELFSAAIPVSQMQIVILARQGNPRRLRTLADLAQPGLKVALGNEQQSTLGLLTAQMLRQAGCYDAVQKNVVGTSPTGDLLVNQMRTGALDATVVYKSNTLVAAKSLDVIPLDLPGATATQTFAIGRQSRHKQLASRFFAMLARPESLKHYEDCGFRVLFK